MRFGGRRSMDEMPIASKQTELKEYISGDGASRFVVALLILSTEPMWHPP